MALSEATQTMNSATSTTAISSQEPEIIFYDIASGAPLRPYAPNPWKARYALNFKRVPYKTHPTPLPSVPTLRHSLNCSPVRKHRDGSDFPTLPIIQDVASGEIVGDSFDIAVWLDERYPLGPRLMKEGEGEKEEMRKWNIEVDRVFNVGVPILIEGLPFDPASAEISKAEFCKRAGRERWEDMIPSPSARKEFLSSFRAELDELAKSFTKIEEGPFVEGGEASYKDLIIGGWLEFMNVTLPDDEWREIREEWSGGVWERLYEALQKWTQGKPRLE